MNNQTHTTIATGPDFYPNVQKIKSKKMAKIAIYQMDLHLHVARHATNAYLGTKLDRGLKYLPG